MSSDQEVCEEPDLGVETEEIICETVFIKSEEDELEDEEDDTPSETYSVEGQRPVRPVERQKMRPWLIDLLDKNILPGLSWQNKRENIFRISWKHAAHNCFNRNRDSDLFERWAFHTGRHHEGNHKRWKANFRCALNSLPDVMELKELGVRKGDNAFKVYKFLDSPEPTMKEKMEIKRKYSLMAGIKLDESHSGSSTPTVSTAPSSPEREGSSGVDGGIQTLLKAIELKTQQQTDMSKTPQKRGSSGGTTQTRSKRAKKDSRDDVPVETEATVVICSGRPSPASTPGSDTISGVQKMPYITAIDPMSGIPYVTAVDQKTGKLTLVQLRKTDSPSAPTTPTGRSEIIIPSSKMLMGLPGQGQSMMAVPQAQTITSTIKCGEHFITVPMSVAASLQKETTTEEKVTIPMQMLQQELQKQAQQQVQQAQQGVPNLINLGNLFASNPAAALHLAKQMSASTGSIPIPVLEQISQAQQKLTEKSAPKTVIQTEVQQVRMVAPPSVSESLPPVPQLNKNITSIAAALRMSIPSTQPSTPSVVTGISSPIQQPQPVSTTTLGPGLAQDPQGIRSKLVSRLMVSGSSMTNQSPGVRMPVSSLIPAPTSTPRPRLDHILVKPNPNLTLPSTHLQPVRTSDMVVMSTASSSSLDFVTGPPKLMTAISERTIDLNANKSTLAFPSTSTHLKNSREADVVSIGSSPSPVCTPELRPDILDRQLTIELSKMEKEPSAQRMTEESQHYLCLWCQINFEKKSDLLHHFLQLHQDMLVVPGESDGQGQSQIEGNVATPTLTSLSAEDSLARPITVPDVSSTSSDIMGAPFENQGDDDDDEPPVIIDVMINTSQHQSQMNVYNQASSTVSQSYVQEPPRQHRKNPEIPTDELSNTSTISAAESLDSISKPKYSLNDLIKALSQSLEQEQANTPQLSVMLSPSIKQFNLAQATALQSDPGLSGIPATVVTGMSGNVRGRGRGRGRGSSNRGRGRGRRKTADISPEMPCLIPEVPKDRICYDNLPESSESGEDEGPPKITKVRPRRAPRSKPSTPAKSVSNTPVMSPLPLDEPFIPGLLFPSAKSVDQAEMGDHDDSSDQAIHVTVKMYEVNGKTIYRCTECNKEFSKTCTFARHAMLHSKMYPYQCGICDMKCGDMRILLRHLDQHAEDADCPCQKCDRMSKDFSVETQKKVSAAFHFKCNICGKKFFSDYACKIHVNTHKRKMTLTCDQCKLEFRCNKILSRHRKAVHDTQFCPVCLETCTNLNMHMRQHVGFTLYRCGLCSDGFNSRPQLHEHLKIHTQLGATRPVSGTSSSASRYVVKATPSTSSAMLQQEQKMSKIEEMLKEEREAKIATETLMALGNSGDGIPTTAVPPKVEEVKNEQGTSGDQSPTDFIVRTGEYEDEDGEIDVHVIPKRRGERFKSKSSDISEDKDISIEPAVAPSPRRQVVRRCKWHGNDSLCERCDETFVKKMSSNRKRRSAERGSATRGRRGSKSPRSDVSDSFRLNSDSLDSLKNLGFTLPLANYILKEDSKPATPDNSQVIELSD
ncbi:uncharacterized protein LOC143051758 [Mytilus galloprovincialis]|uniref:uncharacterized protein LOC143051758 n=1 Tax=Mytilus galloprovincialis TaxID=29158 RepID=UPI003F7BD12E